MNESVTPASCSRCDERESVPLFRARATVGKGLCSSCAVEEAHRYNLLDLGADGEYRWVVGNTYGSYGVHFDSPSGQLERIRHLSQPAAPGEHRFHRTGTYAEPPPPLGDIENAVCDLCGEPLNPEQAGARVPYDPYQPCLRDICLPCTTQACLFYGILSVETSQVTRMAERRTLQLELQAKPTEPPGHGSTAYL